MIMTKDQILAAMESAGPDGLVQHANSDARELNAVAELVEEGLVRVTAWSISGTVGLTRSITKRDSGGQLASVLLEYGYEPKDDMVGWIRGQLDKKAKLEEKSTELTALAVDNGWVLGTVLLDHWVIERINRLENALSYMQLKADQTITLGKLMREESSLALKKKPS